MLLQALKLILHFLRSCFPVCVVLLLNSNHVFVLQQLRFLHTVEQHHDHARRVSCIKYDRTE